MFRFIHAADLHLDSPMLGLSAQQEAPVEQLRGATRRAMENMVELALRESVAFVLLAGDLFDGDWKDYNTGIFCLGQLQRLTRAGISVYVIAGNHDAFSVMTRRLAWPEGVVTFPDDRPHSHMHPSLPVALHGRSFPRRSIDENWVPDYPPRQSGCFNIGLLHTSLSGSSAHDSYAPCQLQDLLDKQYDYWALGHIHTRKIHAENPWVVMPGNMQGRHVRECGPRGCYLVEVDDDLHVSRAEFVATDVLRWAHVHIHVDADWPETLTQIETALQSELNAAEGRLLAVRIELGGRTQLDTQLRARRDALRAELQARMADRSDALWLESLRLSTRAPEQTGAPVEQDWIAEAMALAQEDLPEQLEEIAGVAELIKALPEPLAQALRQALQEENLWQDAAAILRTRQ